MRFCSKESLDQEEGRVPEILFVPAHISASCPKAEYPGGSVPLIWLISTYRCFNVARVVAHGVLCTPIEAYSGGNTPDNLFECTFKIFRNFHLAYSLRAEEVRERA